jgi:ATP/maltotriose-dependent transcriptional regulator MalT
MKELTDKKEPFYQRPKKNRIEDQDIESAIKQDQRAAFARYRELVKARREKEKLSPREPEIYHHDLYKKS